MLDRLPPDALDDVMELTRRPHREHCDQERMVELMCMRLVLRCVRDDERYMDRLRRAQRKVLHNLAVQVQGMVPVDDSRLSGIGEFSLHRMCCEYDCVFADITSSWKEHVWTLPFRDVGGADLCLEYFKQVKAELDALPYREPTEYEKFKAYADSRVGVPERTTSVVDLSSRAIEWVYCMRDVVATLCFAHLAVCVCSRVLFQHWDPWMPWS